MSQQFSSESSQGPSTEPTATEQVVPMPSTLGRLGQFRSIFFRFGLGAIFLTNAATAWLTSADEFREALTDNWLTSMIGHTDGLVRLIGVNDGLLFLLILSGRFRKLAVVWGGVWIAAVIFVTGVRTPDFILHLGVLALLLGYAYSSEK